MSKLRVACSDRTETLCKELGFALVKAFEEEEKGWGRFLTINLFT